MNIRVGLVALLAQRYLYWLDSSGLCVQATVGANTTCTTHFLHTAVGNGTTISTGLCPSPFILFDRDTEHVACGGDVQLAGWIEDAEVACNESLLPPAIGTSWDINRSVVVLTDARGSRPHCYEFRARNASACAQSWLDVHHYQVVQYCPGLCPPEFSVDIPLQSIAGCPDVAFARLGLEE